MTIDAGLRARLLDAKASGEIVRITDAIPYAAFLGMHTRLHRLPPPASRPAASEDLGAAAAADAAPGAAVAPAEFELQTVLTAAPHVIGNPTLPALHGGALGALLESAAVFEVLYRLAPDELTGLPKTITLTIDFLRSAKAVDTVAVARITKVGRRVWNVYAEAWQNDERQTPVAAARVLLLMARS